MTIVYLQTSLGEISLELDKERTPITTENFLEYVRSGFYENTLFHRVIDGFMIQGGGFDLDMSSKTTCDPIINEAKQGLANKKGTIALARTSDPHSGTSQFFINVADNDFLNHTSETESGWGYCAFGKVIKGIEVVEKISHVNTVNKAGHQDVPECNIVIESAVIAEEIPITSD